VNVHSFNRRTGDSPDTEGTEKRGKGSPCSSLHFVVLVVKSAIQQCGHCTEGKKFGLQELSELRQVCVRARL
jgi:hypothetical protein